MSRVMPNRRSTNNMCATTSKRSTGTNGRPRRRSLRKLPPPRPRATSKRIVCSRVRVCSLESLESLASRKTFLTLKTPDSQDSLDSDMTLFDLIVLALVGASFVAGAMRGLVRALIATGALLVGLIVAARGYEFAGALLRGVGLVEAKATADAGGFLLIVGVGTVVRFPA